MHATPTPKHLAILLEYEDLMEMLVQCIFWDINHRPDILHESSSNGSAQIILDAK